ncbi:CPBP family intramembrane metalloprotease [Thiohalocapsa marina]|uniref:CPBP family intramembrane metalloprotease n=1 Tax=Thiohalocapsa marina TaxID=424902 RepID=A0A5M8FSN5_9GAMM|nr:CPBP family intramembrane glutamic endopeptidase [Thiohalocapsa marina]KAA6185402.1 CPBP family intramembrane metalloprotease [Thiohalocapsa marina]
MRITAVFFAYLFACLLLAALLTYPLMQTGWLDYPPQRVMGRLAQVFILLGLWPFLKALRLDNWPALGFGLPRRAFVATIWRGWLIGVAILLALIAALLWLQVRVPDLPEQDLYAKLASRVLSALVAGLLIGLLEESFFRGALFGAVRQRNGVRAAIVWSALLYALLHFMKPHGLPADMAFDWSGTWTMFSGVFVDVFQWRHLSSMVALFMVGVFLALVRERTGHIGWGIGLHAGWVFVIQVSRRLTDDNDAASLAFLVGDYDGIIGWLAAAWVGLLALLYWRFSRPR